MTTENGQSVAPLHPIVMRPCYSVIVVDPPWAYGKDTGRTRTAERHYKTVGNNGKEINRKTGEGVLSIVESVDIPSLAAKDSHLYLWTTNPKLPFAFDVMASWGFTYKTTLTWVKTRSDGHVSGGGMGWFFRGATEHVLFGVRGSKGIPSNLRKPNVVMATTGEHSEKPKAFYDLLRGIYSESETMLDVFSRRQHERFDSWGDQAPMGVWSA